VDGLLRSDSEQSHESAEDRADNCGWHTDLEDGEPRGGWMRTQAENQAHEATEHAGNR